MEAPMAGLFMTSARAEAPYDGAVDGGANTSVSDFLTLQSVTNFAVMSTALAGAWKGLQKLDAGLFSGIWVPYALAGVFGALSVIMSWDAYKKPDGSRDGGKIGMAVFLGFLNSMALASAIIGTNELISSSPATQS
jgi:hypothetical protein